VTPRERIGCVLNHREPDRVPIDLGGTRQSGIAASTYHQLKKRLGVSTSTRVFDVYQVLAEVERPIMERFGADVVGLYKPEVAFGIRNDRWKSWQLFDGTPVQVPDDFNPVTEDSGDLALLRDGQVIARMPKDGFYFDRLEKYPGAAHVDPETYDPPLLSDQDLQHLHAQAEALYQNTDFAVVAPMGPPMELFFGLGTGDFEAWMVTLATEPDYVHALYEKLTAAWLVNLQRFVDAVGDRVQIIQICDDFGTQESLFLSVKMFRNLVMPYYQRGCDWIHKNTDMKIMLHSDGAIFPLIPSIIEMGIDILNPIQTTAKGMDAVLLKREFGDRLVFWGGSCDCQHTLSFAGSSDVQREVEENIRVFASGGGYVFAPVHNIQAGVQPENIIALYDTARSISVGGSA